MTGRLYVPVDRRVMPVYGAMKGKIMKVLRVNMPDGSKWDVPVSVIAQNRAEYYASEFGGDVQKSLDEDTMPLFAADHYEVEDWAANNMNWSDVERVATLAVAGETDYQEGWVNGGKSVVWVSA
jgi:hypothetical protein